VWSEGIEDWRLDGLEEEDRMDDGMDDGWPIRGLGESREGM
jgi:hypothetical protein